MSDLQRQNSQPLPSPSVPFRPPCVCAPIRKGHTRGRRDETLPDPHTGAAAARAALHAARKDTP
jgi:hypothetical protein